MEFSCTASGGHPDQVINVQWLTPINPQGIFSSNNILKLQKVQRANQGMYTCQVQNFNDSMGWATSVPHHLDVLGEFMFQFLIHSLYRSIFCKMLICLMYYYD